MPPGYTAARDYKTHGPPLQECMLNDMIAVHIVWIWKELAYHVRDLHVCPHYTLTAEEVKQLMLKAGNHDIIVYKYDTDKNYLEEDAFIRVLNRPSEVFPDFDKIDMEEIGSFLFNENGQPLTVLKTSRGNFVVNVGVCGQDWASHRTDADKNYKGSGVNRAHLTTTLDKHVPTLTDQWRPLLTQLTDFSKTFDDSLFPDKERAEHNHNMPGYEALTFALIPPGESSLKSHVDSSNDFREGYNSVANYSVILKNGYRLSLIAYTRRTAGDFMDRFRVAKAFKAWARATFSRVRGHGRI